MSRYASVPSIVRCPGVIIPRPASGVKTGETVSGTGAVVDEVEVGAVDAAEAGSAGVSWGMKAKSTTLVRLDLGVGPVFLEGKGRVEKRDSVMDGDGLRRGGSLISRVSSGPSSGD